MRQLMILVLIPFAALGCGGGSDKLPVAKVTGKVMCEGKPLGKVIINFVPVSAEKGKSGRMGTAIAKEDGTFTVSTYGTEDGAVVGKHDVGVAPPSLDDSGVFNCNCQTVGAKVAVEQVEVTADGENFFTINLPPKTNKNASNMSPKALREYQEEQQADKAPGAVPSKG